MKSRQQKAVEVLHAKETLAHCGLHSDAQGNYPDFDQLSRSTVERLLTWADVLKYQKPKAANGSRARYFYQLLCRRAAQRKGGQQ